jgi:hypothetical protein
VAPGHKGAPAVTGQTLQDAIDAANRIDWPGYLGSPRLATAAFGEQIWKAFAAAASTQTLSILDGADPSAITRYVDLLEKNPAYQKAWIQPALARDAAMEGKQREWLLKKRK